MMIYYGDVFTIEAKKSVSAGGAITAYSAELVTKRSKDEFKKYGDYTFSFNKDMSVLSIKIFEEGVAYYECSVSSISHNCGMVLISGLTMSGERDIGLFKFLDSVVALCKKMGYSQALYTTYQYQVKLHQTLTLSQFKELKETTVTNRRSGNEITVWFKNLW